MLPKPARFQFFQMTNVNKNGEMRKNDFFAYLNKQSRFLKPTDDN